MKTVISILALAVLATPSAHAQARDRSGSASGEAMAQAISFQAQQPDAALSCQCNELQRRLSGLGAMTEIAKVASFGQRFPAESKKLASSQGLLNRALGDGRAQLDEAKGKSWADQERLCPEGITKTIAVWGEWQAFLSQQGIDKEYYRGVKVDHPTIPTEGDLSDNGMGRVCERGQWWEEDRALWAINAREGICEQARYAIKQILRGGKGDPGYRCFEYGLK